MASGAGTIATAVQAMKDGAFDFLPKPVDVGHMLELIKRALEFKDLKRENTALRTEVAELRGSRIAPVGSSTEMKNVLNLARSVALNPDSSVAHFYLGMAQERNYQYAQADESYAQAASLDPKNNDLRSRYLEFHRRVSTASEQAERQ